MFRPRNNKAFLSLLPVFVTTALVGPLAIAAHAAESEYPQVEVEVEVIESSPEPAVIYVPHPVEPDHEVDSCQDECVCEEHHECEEPVVHDVCESECEEPVVHDVCESECEEPVVYDICESDECGEPEGYEEVYEIYEGCDDCEAEEYPEGGLVETEVILEGQGFVGTFSCVEHPVPTTVFYSAEGALPVIHWVSHYFAHSGWDPLTRCRAVSGRFQNFYEAGILNYLTTGVVNRLPVVCVAEEVGGSCAGVLLTLKPGQDGDEVVQQLFDLSYGRQVGALYESGPRTYISIEQYLEGLADQNP
ncbi:MAG: COP23 domain-containing protein [Leptolyngbyaceae cyanobacterium]